MDIYPAIDLIGGQCVRLEEGDFARQKTYNADPIAQAKEFADAGAEWLHVVDLDGTKNSETAQDDLILEIAKQSGLKVQTGGGIRNETQVKKLLDGGIARVVIGSLAIKDPLLVRDWVKEFGAESITLAMDVQPQFGNYFIATHGWQRTSAQRLWDVVEEFADCGAKHVLCTDISKDGLLQGTNIELYKRALEKFPKLNWMASGGVAALDDLHKLQEIEAGGVIIGKALYENKFTLAEALAICADGAKQKGVAAC